MRRGMMAAGVMRRCQVRFRSLGMMQRMRGVQRRGANAGTGQNQDRGQSPCQNARQLHPASILSMWTSWYVCPWAANFLLIGHSAVCFGPFREWG